MMITIILHFWQEIAEIVLKVSKNPRKSVMYNSFAGVTKRFCHDTPDIPKCYFRYSFMIYLMNLNENPLTKKLITFICFMENSIREIHTCMSYVHLMNADKMMIRLKCLAIIYLNNNRWQNVIQTQSKNQYIYSALAQFSYVTSLIMWELSTSVQCSLFAYINDLHLS